MIARFPSYYNKFRCIADRCRHSCCVGWEIDVDPKTLERYRLEGRENILCHISDGSIELLEGDRCPFLCSDGLCRIISELGDDYTSIICREHPRFYHRVGDIIEGGIGASCEAAAEIILTSDDYMDFIEVEREGQAADETDFDTMSHRDEIYNIISNRGLSFSERLGVVKEKYFLSDAHSDEEWNDILCDLEYLYPEHRGMLKVGGEISLSYEYLERFFAYLIFRHVSISTSYDNLRARLGFCILLTRILGSGASSLEAGCDLARIISEEIEYSEDNTDALILEFDSAI